MDTYCYVGNREKAGKTTNPLGITICRYDEAAGHLTVIENVALELNVGSLFIDRNVLYCTNERPELPYTRIGGGGQIFAFAIDSATGLLTELNHQPSFAPMPNYAVSSGDYVVLANHATRDSHVTISERDDSGKFRVKVLFDDSSLVLYPRRADGSIGEPLDIWKADGQGPIDGIQYGPHLHSVVVSPSGKLFSVCDKGSDHVYLFRVENDRLVIAGVFAADSGYAPRYSIFHPTKPFLFANNEFQPYLYSFRYGEEGKLEKVGCVRVLPEGVENPKSHGQSDLRVSPDGKYLYDMFRQINMIFVYSIDQETGELTCIQSFQSEGKNLRGCAISPEGRFLLVAADESRNVLSYPINPDGTLGPAAENLTLASPANLAFYQPTTVSTSPKKLTRGT